MTNVLVALRDIALAHSARADIATRWAKVAGIAAVVSAPAAVAAVVIAAIGA